MKRVLLLGLAALAAAWLPSARAEPVAIDKRIVLLVDEWKAVRNLPVIVAERLGYFKSDGMDVTVMNTRDDVWHGDMLIDGRIDAVMAYWHHNVVNQSSGRDTQAIVTLGVTPGMKVMVADRVKDRYKSLADLKGSRIIAGGAGSSKTTVANALLLAAGLQLSDYERLPTGGKDDNVAALREGKADLVVAPTPDGDDYEARGVASVFADLTTPQGTKTTFGAPFPTTTVFMSTERMKAHPEIARHLAQAFVLALRYIHTHTADEIAALVPKQDSGKDRQAYLRALKEELPMFAGDGRMPSDGAAWEMRVLTQFNPKFGPVAVQSTYTNAFVDEALARMR
jgi:ABC-type nitrate/sulfonate/bicarbonate transport system substrate-binding protein